MDISVVLVVLGAAFLHAFWNFHVRGTEDKALGMAAVMFGHIPLAIIGLAFVGLPLAVAARMWWPALCRNLGFGGQFASRTRACHDLPRFRIVAIFYLTGHLLDKRPIRHCNKGANSRTAMRNRRLP